MIETVVIWFVSGAIFIGIGRLISWGPREEPAGPGRLALDFWAGIAATVAVLQVWSLFAAINLATVLVVSAGGIGGIVLDRPRSWSKIVAWGGRHRVALSVLVFGILWFSYWGRLLLRHGDTGLYHMGAVRWASEYAAVPGLGNLHCRLAFNSAFHLLGALFEALEPSVETGQLVNGLLSVATVAALSPSSTKPSSPDSRLVTSFDGLLIVALLPTVFTPQYFGLSPDPSIAMLGALVASLLLRLFLGQADPASRVLMVAALAALGLSMKLSFALLATLAPLAAFASASTLAGRERWLRPLLAWSTLVLPWVARNVVLSGHLLFPVAGTRLPVDWAVPRSITIELNRIIQAWGRWPRRFWSEIGSVDWIPHWLQDLSPATTTMAVVALLLWVLAGILRRSLSPLHRKALAGTGLVFGAGLSFWFIASPNDRFIGATLWVLAAAPSAAIFAGQSRRPARLASLLVCVLVLSSAMPLRVQRYWGLRHRGVPKNIEIQTRTTDSGLSVGTPRRGEQCWYADLPCSPNFRPSLQLRRDNLGGGFSLPASPIYAHLTDLPPQGIETSPSIGVALRPATGWSEYDVKRNARTIQKRAKLLVFSSRATAAQLRFEVVEIAPSGEAVLKLSLNGTTPRTIRVDARSIVEIVLDLDADYNTIALTLAGAPRSATITLSDISVVSAADRKLEDDR